MSLGLTVVTHTCPFLGRDITKCVDSVKAALPPGAKHMIIELEYEIETFEAARFDSMKLDDIVVFVDDDDYISPNSLKYCLSALEETDAGIAFTNEVIVNSDGTQQDSKHAMLYEYMYNNPTSIHHMTAFNTKYVTERPSLLFQKYKCSIEWMMKVDAVVNAGKAIHIPIVGYYWVQHSKQHHRDPAYQKQHKEHNSLVKEEMLQWGKLSGPIPHWTIE